MKYNTEDTNDVEIGAAKQRRTVSSLVKLFTPAPQERTARRITSIRQMYYGTFTQYFWDFWARTFLNVGNWFWAVGQGLSEGYQEFNTQRNRFRKERRLRPPIFVTQKQAKLDLEEGVARGEIVWGEE